MTHFRTYQSSILFYKLVKEERLKGELRNQIERAALSICLNLSEGNDRTGLKDRKRFFNMALTSLRECQTIIMIEELNRLYSTADKLGAELYLLNKHCPQ